MRYAVFADIHGNLEAFRALKKALKSEAADECICIGDIVGYGANPAECIKKTKELASVILAGNHDWAVAKKFSIRHFNPYAKAAVIWTRKQLSDKDKKFLYNLPLVYETRNLSFVHAMLIHPEEFDYVLDAKQAAKNLKVQKRPICFIAHSHIPQIYIFQDGSILREPRTDAKINENDKYLINVGSVGQPRDGDTRACYCIFDTDEMTVSIKRISYDFKKASEKIMAAGLPKILAYRLLEGR